MTWQLDIHKTTNTALANAIYDMLQMDKRSWVVLELVRSGIYSTVIAKVSSGLDPSDLKPGPRVGFNESLSEVQLLTQGFLKGWAAHEKVSS
jgi:hypothetical protein